MKRRTQRDFFENDRELAPSRLAHGGDLAKGKRKLIRPLDPRKPLLITMRASRAVGRYSMIAKKLEVGDVVDKVARKNGVTIHKCANNGNHLHMLVSFKRRDQFQRFLRIVTGWIARLVTGARKGKPFGKFWDELAHSRVVIGRKAFQYAEEYVIANQIESVEGSKGREWFLRKQRLRRARS